MFLEALMGDAPKKLNDEQVRSMLSDLEQHFQEPVLPVSRYCGAFSRWFDCIKHGDGSERLGTELMNALDAIHLAISKSSLLWRLIYVGERFRTKRCPVHDGTWSGLESDTNMCPHRCHLTGWIYEGKADKVSGK